MKTGIVLEGGGFRGIYTAGVLDVFMENGIGFDGVIGVSAGAVHGCSFLSGQKGRSINYYTKYCNDWRFMSVKSLIKTGDIVGVEFSYHELPEKLVPYDYEAFKRCNIPFYVVVSNLEDAKAEYIKINDMLADIDYIRASASLPYVSRIVGINGKKYLDGGITDSVPVDAFMDMGFERNVVVLTRHDGYRKKAEHGWLADIVYRKYPEFASLLRDRHNRYNENIERIRALEREGRVFVIRPSEELHIGRLESDEKKVRAVYDIGVRDAKGQLEALRKWLADGK